MVFYLAAMGDGVERYAETDWDMLDVPIKEVNQRVQYADPAHVHPSALADDVNKREQGYWVDPETLPKKILWANGARPLPDVLPWFVVSPRFRELIEQMEPQVHQFVSAEIYRTRQGQPAATYYWLIVGQRLDSVDREHTTYAWQDGSRGVWVDEVVNTTTWEFTPIPGAKLFFSNALIGARHLWHDPHVLTHNNRLCSDALASAITERGFSGVNTSSRDAI